jgi:hypothetical protein
MAWNSTTDKRTATILGVSSGANATATGGFKSGIIMLIEALTAYQPVEKVVRGRVSPDDET